jgi:hypothetical protein
VEYPDRTEVRTVELPTPSHAVVALAAFVRQRLAEVGDTLSPLLARRPDNALTTRNDIEARGAARQIAMVIVGAAAPFASTSYARARLLRQMHASGLLTEREADQAVEILGVAQ